MKERRDSPMDAFQVIEVQCHTSVQIFNTSQSQMEVDSYNKYTKK